MASKEKPMVRLSKEEIRKKQEFIKQYQLAQNAATGSSVDANANVSTKTVATLGAEMWKDCSIQVNRAAMWDKIKDMFGEETANEYIDMLESHLLYKHDESSIAPGVPYTYGPDESVLIKKDGKYIITTFKELYDLSVVNETEVEDGVWVKKPNIIQIYDKNGFVDVTHLTKKVRKREMVYVKTNKGEDLVVTDNHPLIINDKNETIDAVDALDYNQYSCSIDDVTLVNNQYIKNLDDYYPEEIYKEKELEENYFSKNVEFNYELGYDVGSFIADGYYDDNKVKISNRFRYNQKIWNDYEKDYDILFSKYFKINGYLINRGLPEHILETNINFIQGVICGLIDTTGEVLSNDFVAIKSISRKLITNLSILFSILGIGYTTRRVYNDDDFNTYNYTFDKWEIIFDNQFIKGLYNKTVVDGGTNKNWLSSKNTWKRIVQADVLKDYYTEHKDEYLDEMDYIYDITTDSHTFVCNGLWVHNCVAISMYPFLEHGMKGLGGESDAPHHLESFCGSFINLVFAISSQFAGACEAFNQKNTFNINGITKNVKIKDFTNMFDLNKSFISNNDVWEYADISDKNIMVAEDGKFVKVNKVFRRKYSDKIYHIKTHSGKEVFVSKDHKFKHYYQSQDIQTKAEDLKVGDTVYANYDYTYAIDKNSEDYRKGQCLGIIAGDGNITAIEQARVSVNENQSFIMDFLDENLKFLDINPVGTRMMDKRGGVYTYYIGSTKIVNKIRSYFEQNTYSTIDKNINLSDKSLNFKLGYLDGLMATDGSYRKGNILYISLINEKLIASVKSILEDLHIYKNYSVVPAKRGNRHTMYTIYMPVKLTKYLDLTIRKPQPSTVNVKTDRLLTEKEIYYINEEHDGKYKLLSSQLDEYSNIKFDVIESIETYDNDDEYVYEIETETHWYNCGGLITHNCATSEFLLYFHHFATQEYGKDYLKTHRFQIDNEFQSVIYSLNQPSAARGYQCVSETTQLWTPDGWKKYSELSVNDTCYVYKNGQFVIEPIQKINVYDVVKEKMYKFIGDGYSQTVTGNHRVAYIKDNKLELELASNLDSNITVPVNSVVDNEYPKFPISDKLLQLCAYAIAYGMTDKTDEISKNPEYGYSLVYMFSDKSPCYEVVKQLLTDIGVQYTTIEENGRFVALSEYNSQIILHQLKNDVFNYPYFFSLLDKEQCEQVLQVLDLKFLNYENCTNQSVYYIETRKENYDILSTMALKCGYSCVVKDVNDMTIEVEIDKIDNGIKISNIEEIEYTGKVWCPTTDAGVVIFRENEYTRPFISGNSVFFNLSVFDRYYYDSMFGNFRFPDGTHYTYEEFNPLQLHFLEWLLEERKKSLLTFPVLTEASLNDPETHEPKDLEWLDKMSDLRSRGLSFFTYNDTSASALSSCCFSGDEEIEIYNKDNGIKQTITIKDFVERYITNVGEVKIDPVYQINGYSTRSNKMSRVFITGVLKKENNKKLIMITIEGNTINVTVDHMIYVKNKNTEEFLKINAGKLVKYYHDYQIPVIDNNCMVKFMDIDKMDIVDTLEDYVYDIELSKYHYFPANNIITHNCRLRNEIDANEFSYTLGGGLGVQSGSTSVMTLNMPKMIQETIIKKLKEKGVIGGDKVEKSVEPVKEEDVKTEEKSKDISSKFPPKPKKSDDNFSINIGVHL